MPFAIVLSSSMLNPSSIWPFLDAAIGKVYESCKKNGFVLYVTSDHGNAEQMLSPEGKPHTAHTVNRGTVLAKAN